jgi:polyphosphate kinase
VKGVSENIRVTSVVGRFLEHSRIYEFQRNGDTTTYIGSADLMPRNLDTRVELLAPLRDEGLRLDLADTLDRCFADNTNAWELDSEGAWTRPGAGDGEPRSVHRELMAAHQNEAAEAASQAAQG